jgi:3-hydroxymyristoyl/3-hydroxydecanoyl-(acyl carrier protein) dehydratase
MPDGTATRHFNIGHPSAEGHFPGNPIIPGAVLLREVVSAISAGNADSGCEIRSAKFHQPVRPGDTLVIRWTAAADRDIRFSCSIDGTQLPVVTGSLRLMLS